MQFMAPPRNRPANTRLLRARNAKQLSQHEFARRFFKTSLRSYQRWESMPWQLLPGPVKVIVEALERGKLPD